jgi:hypothetical protein
MDGEPHQQVREVDAVSAPGFGNATMAPLDRWGTAFVWWAGAWILVVGSTLFGYFLWKMPGVPNTSGLSPDQVKEALNTHQVLTDELRNSLMSVFDLLVTKTALPVITLMLGYLFGKRQA